MKYLNSIMEAAVTKKVIISGYYGFNNFGDEEILSILVSKLKEWGADITVFSSNPDWSSNVHSVNTVNSFCLPSIIKEIKISDILISGGGSLLQDVTSLKSLIYYTLIIFLALFFRKKVIIFAQGIGPINNPVARFLVLNILKFCTYITVRDEKSYNLLKRYGVDSKIVPDPVYSLKTAVTEHSGVGIQLRRFKSMNEDFLSALAKKVVETFSGKSIKIISLQDALDFEVCKTFESKLKEISPDIDTELVTNTSLNDIINRLSSLEYLIAMRFHALLIGIKSGVKSLGINYDIKVEQLAADASVPLISLTDFSDFDEKFDALLAENTANSHKFAESRQFDWASFKQYFEEN